MANGDVVASVNALPERFLPERAGTLRARFRLEIGNLSRDVVIDDGTCSVVPSQGAAEVTICTSPSTWYQMNEGRSSGIEAFAQRRLTIRGSIQKALLFEPLFKRPSAGGLRYVVEQIPVAGQKISTLTAGSEDLPPLIMMHGLGATKASVLTLIPELARHMRVYAVDLPGFGSSTKPRGRYDAPWFAERMFGFMDELGIERASLVGNSMGGRIAQEMVLMDPDRVEAAALLCPATAFSHRPGLPLVKLLRPELGITLGYIPRARVITTLKSLFARPERIEDAWYAAATDDFLRTWRSPRARMAFFAAARNIYLEEPYGTTGFFTRLKHARTRLLYIYGRQDVVITPHFARKIKGVLPTAQVELWEDCGHVPQLEQPERTLATLLDFFAAEARTRATG